MGDKIEAKRIAKKCGLPVIEGSEGGVKSFSEAKSICKEIGYPVLIKAAGGGGGKGMKVVEEEDKYNAFDVQGQRFTSVLFPPVKGGLSSVFNVDTKHYGVDIVIPENSPVHSISEGIVVFSEWTSTTGFVIIIEHLNGLTSIYKHNSSIVKNQGDRVDTGEIIAFSGDTGSLTTGPHLHFELWHQGEPVDPQSYIDF